MNNLQMVDLKRQYHKIKDQIDTAITDVVESALFIGGPVVKGFSEELAQYLDVKHVIPCANGTDAIQIALMALGLQPGDEVITPSFTFVATVEVVGLLRLKPVFVDVDPENYNILPDAIRKAITPRTKAIIPVHLYGQSAPMEEILAIANEYHIPVIEDTAQAIGGTYTFSDGTRKKNGTIGTIGTTSFFPSKNLGCYGDGGAIFTNDDTLAEKLLMIANHGQKVRYYHEMVGMNSRLDAVQAAVLRIKLPLLDQYCDARRSAADYYDRAFANQPHIFPPKRETYAHHVFHQYTLRLSRDIDRDEVVKRLSDKGIPSMIYYPVPCHRQKMFEHLDIRVEDLTHTEMLNPSVISLPMHTELTDEELSFISNAFLQIINGLSSK
ncbi:MAG: DegT/DnrJ/EryC1/StrS family aminotransferase [Taibaiella sp.]|nr:DegT/DnrJ/EryC1/StrS family aminotransferase [Taibaiella sp.]